MSSSTHETSHNLETSHVIYTNHHSMITRSKHGIYKPKALALDLSLIEPRIVKQTLNNDEWKESMQKTFDALIQNKT